MKCGAPAACSAASQASPAGGRDFCRHWSAWYQSPIFKDGFINQAQMDELTARGGIGEILGALLMPKAAWWRAKSTG
jgi:hypothetical protein